MALKTGLFPGMGPESISSETAGAEPTGVEGAPPEILAPPEPP